MDIRSLKRDGNRVHANLIENPDGSITTLKDCKLYIPSRYESIGLASIGVETHVVGLYALVYEDSYYAVCNVNSIMQIAPTSTERIKIGQTEYFEFSFSAGSIFITNTNLVKRDILTYYIYDELISAGKIPWYLSYEDVGSLFDTAKEYAGADIGQNREITEMIVSLISRVKNDRGKFFRTLAKDESIKDTSPAYIPLRSVLYAATNTTNKLAGSYMQHGVVSALVNPSESVEKIEHLLRL